MRPSPCQINAAFAHCACLAFFLSYREQAQLRALQCRCRAAAGPPNHIAQLARHLRETLHGTPYERLTQSRSHKEINSSTGRTYRAFLRLSYSAQDSANAAGLTTNIRPKSNPCNSNQISHPTCTAPGLAPLGLRTQAPLLITTSTCEGGDRRCVTGRRCGGVSPTGAYILATH